MEASVNKQITVTLIMEDREAKLLACLIGAASPKEIQEIILRGMYFEEWIGELGSREVTTFTGNLYDALYEALI